MFMRQTGHDRRPGRRRLAGLAALFCGLAAWPAAAQQAPVGDHYAARSVDSGFGAQVSSAFGAASAGIPLDLPPARGGLPLPLSVRYTGSNLAGPVGVGWTLPLSYVLTSHSISHRRPEHRFGAATPPAPVERVDLALGGAQMPMVLFDPDNGLYRPQTGALPYLLRRADGGAWVLSDGTGIDYDFAPQPGVPGDSFAYLRRITGPSPGSEVRLDYDVTAVPLGDGPGATEILLSRIEYNDHPGQPCSKHEIALDYTAPRTRGMPDLSVFEDMLWATTRRLDSVAVRARTGAACDAPFGVLRRYEFNYRADADTGRPRLHSVDLGGRQDTPEETRRLRIATFDYGQATRDGALVYEAVPGFTLPEAFASVAEGLSGTTTRFGTIHDTGHGLRDVTGDGLPDLVFPAPPGGGLRFVPATPGAGAVYDPAPDAARDVFPPALDPAPLGQMQTGQVRYRYSNRRVYELTWVQQIDVNGDGRLDIVDAREGPHWKVLLNMPGPDGAPEWLERTFEIDRLRQHLASIGVPDIGGPLPLARSQTGLRSSAERCVHVAASGEWQLGCPEPDGSGFDPPPAPDRYHTIGEWEIADFNGDGYPDVIANALPVDARTLSDSPFDCVNLVGRPADAPVGQLGTCRIRDTVDFPEGATNALDVFLNQVGVEPLGEAFAAPLRFGGTPHCGLQHWPESFAEKRMRCGLVDVNGDRLLDRVVGVDVYLNTGRAFGPVLRAPGPARVMANERWRCGQAEDAGLPAEEVTYDVWQSAGYIDLTGDGLPDYVERARSTGSNVVHVGTGAGFADPIPVTGPFRLGATVERCASDDAVSVTTAGLFDLDGDGRKDVLRRAPGSGPEVAVATLIGPGGRRGAPDAGRLTGIANAFGARLQFRHASAKTDTQTAHAVPFPELVVSEVRVTGPDRKTLLVGPTRHAYGGAGLIFDAFRDQWRFPGYRRSVSLMGEPAGAGRLFGRATITDRLPRGDLAAGATEAAASFRAFAQTGRVSDQYMLSGAFTDDPASLLALDPAGGDRRIRGGIHLDYDSVSHSTNPAIDCTLFDGRAPTPSGVTIFHPTRCRATGQIHVAARMTWRGETPPWISDRNIVSRDWTVAVDDLGRPLKRRYANDVTTRADDVCETFTYARPVGQRRILDRPATWRLDDCAGRRTYSGLRLRYDDRPEGQVFRGLQTAETVEVYALPEGQKTDEFLSRSFRHDALGKVAAATSFRTADSFAETTITYDPFGLVPVGQHIAPSDGTAGFDMAVEVDPFSLVPTGLGDRQGNLWRTRIDGFGRPTYRTLRPAGDDTEQVLQAFAYREGGTADTAAVTLTETTYRAPVALRALEQSGNGLAPPAFVTEHEVDSLGRRVRTLAHLGADYGNRHLVLQDTTHDRLGRVIFVADPYVGDGSDAVRYGTSSLYHDDGSLACSIRGSGYQDRAATDLSADRYATCTEVGYAAHESILRTRDPAQFLPGGGADSAVRQVTIGANGMAREVSAWQGTRRIELTELDYDILGQPVSQTRYGDPQTRGMPVTWRTIHDSLGRLVRAEEPGIAARNQSYDRWGQLAEIRRQTAGGPEATRIARDALGRPTLVTASRNGAILPGSAIRYHYDRAPDGGAHPEPANLAGHLAAIETATATAFFGYDPLGRLSLEAHQRTGWPLAVARYGRAHDGLLQALDFPAIPGLRAAERLLYRHDSAGRLRGIAHDDFTTRTALMDAASVDDMGQYRSTDFGNATREAAAYAATGRRAFEAQDITTADGSYSGRIASRDALARMTARDVTGDLPDLGAGAEVTRYDALGRVGHAARLANGVLRSEDFTFDGLGNLLSVTTGGGTTRFIRDPADWDRLCDLSLPPPVVQPDARPTGPATMDGTTGPGSMPAVVDPGSTGVDAADLPDTLAPPDAPCRVRYDARGAVTAIDVPRLPRIAIGYDAYGRLSGITSDRGTVTTGWGPTGALQELRQDDTATGETRVRISLGGLIDIETRDGTPATVMAVTRQVHGPGGRLAELRGPGTADIRYHHDPGPALHLTTDATGVVMDRDHRSLFGAARSGPDGALPMARPLWNGGLELHGFGVQLLGARLYHPLSGRFLQRDPITHNGAASRSHPYAYAFNDPVNFADASGLSPWGSGCTGPEACGGITIGPGGGFGSLADDPFWQHPALFPGGSAPPNGPPPNYSYVEPEMHWAPRTDAGWQSCPTGCHQIGPIPNQGFFLPEDPALQFAAGMVEGGWLTVKGLAYAVAHPVKTYDAMVAGFDEYGANFFNPVFHLMTTGFETQQALSNGDYNGAGKHTFALLSSLSPKSIITYTRRAIRVRYIQHQMSKVNPILDSALPCRLTNCRHLTIEMFDNVLRGKKPSAVSHLLTADDLLPRWNQIERMFQKRWTDIAEVEGALLNAGHNARAVIVGRPIGTSYGRGYQHAFTGINIHGKVFYFDAQTRSFTDIMPYKHFKYYVEN